MDFQNFFLTYSKLANKPQLNSCAFSKTKKNVYRSNSVVEKFYGLGPSKSNKI